MTSTTTLPVRLASQVELGLGFVSAPRERDELRAVVYPTAERVYERYLSKRTPDDNTPGHEFVVFLDAMLIAEAERFSLSERIVVADFCFLHDTYAFRRRTEGMIRDALRKGNTALAAAMRAENENGRREHMAGGARITDEILRELQRPDDLRERTVSIVARHDCWKLGEPHPLGADRVACVCFEADTLYPLHPIGVLADLERPDEDGAYKDITAPCEWRHQIEHSVTTLRKYRANWARLDEQFQDDQTIFRTAEGFRLYRAWCEFWGL